VEISESGAPKIGDVIDDYLSFAVLRMAPPSFEVRARYLGEFREAIGVLAVSEAKPLHLIRWLNAHPQWRSDWTKNSIVHYVQACFNWAADIAETIPRNPFRIVKHAPGLPRRNVTQEEFQTMLRASAGRKSTKRPSAGARFRQILIFLKFSGCRPGEAASLRWEHINWSHHRIVIPQHKTVRSQRQPKPRVVQMHPVVVKLLRVLLARRQSAFIFLTFRLTPWNRHSLSMRVRRARKTAGIPADAKLYGVRHEFGTRAIKNGCDLKTVATLMGHNSTRMTEHYLHLAGDQEHLANAIRKANR
jgi:integrase